MKVGLIALSGVRAQNPELMELGLTLPGFVERKKVVAALPSLGLLTLAGMTPPDIELEYVEVPDLEALAGLPGPYDAVALSSFTAQINAAYELADRYRSGGTPVILGGLHVTALPEEARRHADAVVIGEGEPLWPELIRDLRGGALEPVYDARGFPFDLAQAPMPRYELLEIEKYNRLTVQTQRGCPFRCEFCASSILISPVYKLKPIEKVIAEVRRIKEIWPHPFIEFADDNSFVNKAHSRRLLRELAKENVRWFTETDLSIAEDAELLSLMRDSGCEQVLIGFESAVASALNGLETRSNWKLRQFDHYRAAIDTIQGHGITVDGCFVLGLDGTGTESFEQVWEFARESGLYEVQITVQTAFPGTPLYARLAREGRLMRRGAWEFCTLFDVNFCPSDMSVEELEMGMRELSRKLYSAEAVHARRRRFHEQNRARRAGGNP
jgi:radical SAM superfamily enzyme YgiQ (UPF0313 family)